MEDKKTIKTAGELRELARLDPALASNIFLTLITDIVGFAGFLLAALLLL